MECVYMNVNFVDAYVIASMILVTFLFGRTVTLARKVRNRNKTIDWLANELAGADELRHEYYELLEAYSKTLPPF